MNQKNLVASMFLSSFVLLVQIGTVHAQASTPQVSAPTSAAPATGSAPTLSEFEQQQIKQELQRIEDQANKTMAIAEDVNRKMRLLSPSELILAAFQNDVVRAGALLQQGVDPNIRDERYNLNALAAAASKGSVDVITLLLNKGADINRGDLSDYTPLMTAAMYNQSAAVKALVARGANVRLKNKAHQTAAGVAKMRGYEELAQYLLQEEKKAGLEKK